MKNLLFTTIILILLVSCDSKKNEINHEKEKTNVQKVLSEYFNALAERNWEKLRSLSTDDMILVEHGLLWNNDSLINVMEKYWVDYEVNYSFDFIKTQVYENCAWAIYRNHGVAKKENQILNIHWIENAIFIKELDVWKIRFINSTKQSEPEIINESEE